MAGECECGGYIHGKTEPMRTYGGPVAVWFCESCGDVKAVDPI